MLGSAAPWARAYFEDITTSAGLHSTFHYEFTRTLARAAGFSAEDADFIAVVAAATDLGDFQGDLSTSAAVTVQGTGRFGASHLYFHFGRRGTTNAGGDFTYPGARDTCAYFVATADACSAEPELDEIERWAVDGTATPAPGVPQIAVNGAAAQPVAARSLAALAIYAHALADSYSHEACMQATHTRGHADSPPECTVRYWHLEAEYGPSDGDHGVPFTKEAGLAMWLALGWFRQQNGLAAPPLWDDDAAQAFVKQWAELDAAQDRHDLAAARFNALAAAPSPTATVTSTATATPTVTPTARPCVGDCSGDHAVTVDELVKGVNIALGSAPLGDCRAFDSGGDGKVTVDELVTAVNNALNGCPRG